MNVMEVAEVDDEVAVEDEVAQIIRVILHHKHEVK
jgi:hypothetical protein